MNYNEKLKSPKWQKKRLEILNRDDFTCIVCGDKETQLHIHHKSYKDNPWDVDNSELETICKHCHSFLHNHKINKPEDYKIKKIKNIFNEISLYIAIKNGLIIMYLYNYGQDLEENGVVNKEILDALIKIYE